MDLVTIQLAQIKGKTPTHQLKSDILQLFQMIEAAHEKIAKVTATKDDLNAFLEKCVTAVTKPKLLRDIAEISDKVGVAQGHMLEVKAAEEKRKEREAKREAKAKAPIPMQMIQNSGSITMNVYHMGGAISHVPPLAPTIPPPPKQGKARQKKPIPKNVRNQTWNRYIGKEKGEAPCMCCGIHKIDKAAFEAGHVVPECLGGPSTIENLRPICGECNRSMGSTDMREYVRKYYGREL